MLKIFTEIDHYNNDYRIFLSELLRPLLPIERFDKFGIDNEIICLVKSIEESDICLLPMAWNYYLKTKQINKALELILKAQIIEKKILVWVVEDYFIDLPSYNNIIGLYTSPYQSKKNVITISLPSIIRDPLRFLELNTISIRSYNDIPSIGFCGQCDPNLIFSVIKMIKLAWQNLKYYLSISKYYPGSIIPPTYIRKKVLDILDKNHQVHTNFLRRERYKGGELKNKKNSQNLRKEFYQNINNTDYTVCIRGSGNFSTRFYETLAMGRVPIFINTDCVLPFEEEINWKKHVVWVEYYEIDNIVSKVHQFHHSLRQESFQQLERENRMLWEKYFKFSGFVENLTSYLKQTYK